MLKHLFVIKAFTLYNAIGLFDRTIGVGAMIKGEYNAFLGGYRCKTDDGIEYAVFHDEVVVC